MLSSKELYLVALLDEYIGPTPVMAEFVRAQLLSEVQMERIREAVEDKVKGESNFEGPYQTLLEHSGFCVMKNPSHAVSVIERGIIHNALFDLMTARRVKLLQTKGYSDVHEARALIKLFFVKNQEFLEDANLDRLWWDEAESIETDHKPWTHEELRQNPKFVLVVESWLKDSELLQTFLDRFEGDTPVVNNPRSENRVFSHEIAVHTIAFSEVRYQI